MSVVNGNGKEHAPEEEEEESLGDDDSYSDDDEDREEGDSDAEVPDLEVVLAQPSNEQLFRDYWHVLEAAASSRRIPHSLGAKDAFYELFYEHFYLTWLEYNKHT